MKFFTKTIFITIFLSTLLFQILNHKMSNSNDGLTLELIPPTSPKSPFFNTSLHHPYVKRYLTFSVVELALGSFNGGFYKTFFLVVDTGSSLTWLQCEGCEPSNCYPQKQPPFPNSKSMTFKPLPCDENPLCDKGKCSGGHCSYSVQYVDGDSSKGILAKETFTFPPNPSSPTGLILKDQVFGCGTENKASIALKIKNYEVAGVFGLGQGTRSFVKQNYQITKGKFSHCFVTDAQFARRTYLKFGSHIKPPSNIQTIRFYQRSPLVEAYYVKLIDVGIAGKPLHIDPKVIDPPKKKNSGGCIIDSGFSTSALINAAYDKVITQFKQHFSSLPEFIEDPSCNLDMGDRLCVRRNSIKGYKDLPTFTFYFEGAQLDVSSEGVFRRTVLVNEGKECFCVMMRSDAQITAIGHFQQVNFKFIYDVSSNLIHFGQEDCAKNS